MFGSMLEVTAFISTLPKPSYPASGVTDWFNVVGVTVTVGWIIGWGSKLPVTPKIVTSFLIFPEVILESTLDVTAFTVTDLKPSASAESKVTTCWYGWGSTVLSWSLSTTNSPVTPKMVISRLMFSGLMLESIAEVTLSTDTLLNPSTPLGGVIVWSVIAGEIETGSTTGAT